MTEIGTNMAEIGSPPSNEDDGGLAKNSSSRLTPVPSPFTDQTKNNQGDDGNDTSSKQSANVRTPSTSSATEVSTGLTRRRASSDVSHSRASRQASLAPSFDGRRSNASAFPGDAEAYEDPQVEDSAYSWVVAAGASLQFVLVGGIHKSFGLVLAALVQQYNFTSAEVAVIPALFYSISFLVAPLCGALCRRFSERSVCLCGGILTMLGLALSGLVDNIYMLYVTNGLIFGVGQGFSNLPGTFMVTKYFVKRRGLANSINAASAAIGGVFFPLLVQAMLEEYGLPGTYLMMGGLQLHTSISAVLYRPMEMQRKIMKLERRRVLRKQCKSELLPVTHQEVCLEKGKNPLPEEEREEEKEEATSTKLLSGSGAEKRTSLTVCEQIPRHRRPSATLASSTIMLSQLSVAVEAPAAPQSAGCWQQVARSLDFNLLTQPLYLICVASVFLFAAGLPHVCLLIPRFGPEIGVSRGQIANMIATIAPIDIVSRLSLGFLLDRNLFHKRYGLLITCVVGGVGVLSLVFVHSYAALFASCSVVYAAVGFYFVVTPVMYAEYYGVERLSSTLTMSNLFAGLANLTAQPLGGLLRDTTGTFRTVFAVLAACMLVGGGLVLLHPCIDREKCAHKRQEEKQVP